ncbi:MAG: hypothetical protein SOR95_00845 [Sutterella sp.]|nr:hypothetical protein [Sutterella sp.]
MTQTLDESKLTSEQKQIDSISKSFRRHWIEQELKALEIAEVKDRRVIRSTVNGVVVYIEERPNHWIERPNMTWGEVVLAKHPQWTWEDMEDMIQAFGF